MSVHVLPPREVRSALGFAVRQTGVAKLAARTIFSGALAKQMNLDLASAAMDG